MNSLDELLSSAGRVPGITPGALGNARAALDAAIAQQNASMRQPESPASRKEANRWWGGRHGRTIIGVTAMAAAAVAAVIAVPLPASHPGTHPLADSSSRAPVKAKPGKTGAVAAPATGSPVKYSFSPATTDVAAAYVLDRAAQAASSQPVNGWPNAPYWHTESQFTCDGKVYTNNTWIDRSGNGVGQNTGPKPKDPACGNLVNGGAPFPLGPGTPGAAIAQKQYTWSELEALPTDPAKLWPIVRADEELPFTPGPAPLKPGHSDRYSGQSDLFQSILNLLTSAPVRPALRKALYEVSAKIPGVTVAGKYTDSLGRTGTALRIGIWTMAVDTSNGQVLAMHQSAAPAAISCSDTKFGDCHEVLTAGTSTTVYISEGPAASAPSVPRYDGPGGEAAVPSAAPTPSSGSSR